MPKTDRRDIVGLAMRYDAGTVIAPHRHPAHQIIHATSGTMRVLVADRLWFVPPGRALWVPSNTIHGIECSGPVEMRTAYLSAAYAANLTSVAAVSVSALMREALVRLAASDTKDVELLLAEVLLVEIETGVLEPFTLPVPKDARLARLCKSFRENPENQDTLVIWAKRLGFSERNLIRRIRAETGMTFRELRRLTRLMVALDRLASGASVTETAYDVGFETPSAFIHAFKVVFHETPHQFMRREG